MVCSTESLPDPEGGYILSYSALPLDSSLILNYLPPDVCFIARSHFIENRATGQGGALVLSSSKAQVCGTQSLFVIPL